MMIDNKAGERLTHNQADIERQTRILSACTTRAFQCHDVVGIGKQNVLGSAVGDDLLKVAQLDRLFQRHQLHGRFCGNDFGMIPIGELALALNAIKMHRRAQKQPRYRPHKWL